jgi:ACS family sodium-dependent inorganic phosphate cotransporter-like MFS transporter 5
MAKSSPLWAIIIAHGCSNWGEHTLLTSLPDYMKNVLKFDIKSVSI